MKKCTSLITILVLVLNYLLCVNAQSSNINCLMKSDKSIIHQDEELILSFSLGSDEKIEVGTFRLVVNFDSEVFDFKKVQSDNISSSELKYSCANGKLTVVYLRESIGVVADSNSCDLFDIKFKTKEAAPLIATKITAEFDGVGDAMSNPINFTNPHPITINVQKPEEKDCTLTSLETSNGNLAPEFSPNITNYTLDVPYNVDRIEIYAEPSDETASVKISRRTLQKPGIPTIINITVTSQDKSTKLVYQITVNRVLNGSVNSAGSSKSNSKKTSSSLSKASDVSNPNNDNYTSTSKRNKAPQNKSIYLKNNKFSSFLGGSLLSALVIGIAFAYYTHKNKKNKDNDS